MELKNLFSDDRAVSPVIGVILMVAITVILAAVIGTFVLGLGDQVQSTTPQASFGFEAGTTNIVDEGGGSHTEVKTMTITHESGDTIDDANVKITVDGLQAYSFSSNTTADTFTSDVSAGSSTTIVAATDEDVEIGVDTYHYDTAADGDDLTIVDDSAAADLDAQVGLQTGQTVRVTYNNPDSDSSSTLGKRDVQ